MRCPECVAEGARSRVTVGVSTINAVYVPTVYDEDGQLVPGRAGGSTEYSCSRGHRWTETTSPAPPVLSRRGASSPEGRRTNRRVSAQDQAADRLRAGLFRSTGPREPR